MSRLLAGRRPHRRQSEWDLKLEGALERRRQKQARTDEFFEIYRRVTAFVDLAPYTAQHSYSRALVGPILAKAKGYALALSRGTDSIQHY